MPTQTLNPNIQDRMSQSCNTFNCSGDDRRLGEKRLIKDLDKEKNPFFQKPFSNERHWALCGAY